ncbi:MAG: UDP-glucose 4-epimerase GalE [Proteobacteria bacterium]|nr:UDP-glucose 4-epimerase GalE [Pseudomonadota bacterium]
MTILLTGGAGYIGTHTAVVLLAAGHDVVLLDNLSNSNRGVLRRLAKITGREVPLIEADVRDTARVAQALRNHACTAVVHFAGLKAVGESVQKPIDYFANNVQGTISLLQAMDEVGVRSLVFSSSATVYGAPQYLPLDEQHPTSATNPYGRSKLHIEEMLADVCVSSAAWRVACLRYFNPAGAHASGLLGEDPQGIPNNLMPYVAKVAGGELPRLGVFGNDYDTPDGTGVRDYIHVMDLAEGHLAALRFLQGASGWHAINLGTGQGYSVLEMVRAFESASGKPVPYDIKPRRAGDVGSCYANPAKAKELLGWEATRGLQEMCDSMWLWQRR